MLALNRLEKSAIHRIMAFFMNQQSVLGGTAPTGDLATAQHRTMLIVYPLGTLKYLIEISLFVVALIATKELVRMTLAEQRAEFITALRGILPRCREALFFSIKYMAVMAIFGSIMVALASAPISPELLRQLFTSKTLVFGYALAGECCLAWLLLPAAIRLLRPPASPPISTQQRKLGTILAAAAFVSSTAIEYLIGRTEAAITIGNYWESWAIAVANTVIINAPEVMLFVALALMAIQESSVEPVPAAEPEMS